MRLSVSRVERWRRDPYGLYARSILGLDPLDPLEADLGAADRGSALHEALDEFLKAHPSGRLPPDALQRFEALGERHLADILAAPAERAFWWPRFQRLARWFVATENARRANGARLLGSETKGSVIVGGMTIEAIADRIDDRGDGTWDVIDYKTGRVPSKKELDALFAPQLLLEAAMAARGGFEKVKGTPKSVAISYWQANGLDIVVHRYGHRLVEVTGPCRAEDGVGELGVGHQRCTFRNFYSGFKKFLNVRISPLTKIIPD